MAKRTEKTILAEIEAARAAYQKVAGGPEKETRKLSDKVHALMAEYTALLSSGATKCPECGSQPIGMKRRPGLYEVGCHGKRGQGETPEEAAEAWATNPDVYDPKTQTWSAGKK